MSEPKPRYLTDHKQNAANERITLVVLDEKGHGGANHVYQAELIPEDAKPPESFGRMMRLEFQNGPIQKMGVNGITHEVLLAVLIDRMRGFQAGKYSCRENAIALTKLEEALMWLHKRTQAREARGVEGTHEV